MAWVTERANGVWLSLHIQPRASRTKVVGVHGDALKLSVQAPPVDGAANEEITRFLAKALGVPTRNVRILTGETGRRKVIEVEGVTATQALSLLPPSTS